MAGNFEEEFKKRIKAQNIRTDKSEKPVADSPPKKRRMSCLGVALATVAVLAVAAALAPETPPKVLTAQEAAQRREHLAHKEAMEALSNTEALTYCQRLVEQSAKWEYDWESFTSTPDDVTYARATTDDGDIEVTVRGSGLKLQNGFGAWARRDFSCSVMAKTKKVTDLQIY